MRVIMLKLGVPTPFSTSSSASLVLNTKSGLFLSRILLKNLIISRLVGLSFESKLLLLWGPIPGLYTLECRLCEFICLLELFWAWVFIVRRIWFSSLSYLSSSLSPSNLAEECGGERFSGWVFRPNLGRLPCLFFLAGFGLWTLFAFCSSSSWVH